MLDAATHSLFYLILKIVDIYSYVIVAAVVMSWLIQFNMVNRSNQFIYMMADALYRMTEPVFRRIRRYLPDMGGLDLSPIVVIFALFLLKDFMRRLGV